MVTLIRSGKQYFPLFKMCFLHLSAEFPNVDGKNC